jgi:2,3-dihydroxy-p-cumate/2,3-dihydroxybenzoate 3,4-dioxygenase
MRCISTWGRTSDEIDGRINLMRCFPNPYHHSFGIAHADRNSFHHLNLMVTDEKDLSAARRRFAEHDVPIVWQGTHPPSGNTFLFFLDPDGLSLEYGHGMERFPEHGARDARVFPPKPESFDSTGAQRDDRTASVGAIETAQTS